jgi:hypothetical protein
MRKTVFKAFVFTIIIIAIVIVNMYVFRSELPILWLITLIGSVIGLIFFPYKTFFNNKKTN